MHEWDEVLYPKGDLRHAWTVIKVNYQVMLKFHCALQTYTTTRSQGVSTTRTTTQLQQYTAAPNHTQSPIETEIYLLDYCPRCSTNKVRFEQTGSEQ